MAKAAYRLNREREKWSTTTNRNMQSIELFDIDIRENRIT